jgi:N-acetylmuramoyl-L-alanine amidase
MHLRHPVSRVAQRDRKRGVHHARPPRTLRRSAAALLALVLAASASYTVRPGDTLSGIAAAHGTSTRALAEANNISNTNFIVAGRTLTIPGSAATGAASGAARTHTVASGETLSGIAVRYGVRSSAIAAANSITNPNSIRAGQRLTIPGGASTAASPGRTVGTAGAPAGAASRAEVGALIERTARQHGWNPAFVQALAWQESGWNNSVVSSAGAVGIMQIMPGTGTWISQNLAGRTLNIHDPADNVLAGVLFLDYLWKLTGRDVDMTLAGYYQGLASVRANGMYPSTVQYIANVKALRQRF